VSKGSKKRSEEKNQEVENWGPNGIGDSTGSSSQTQEREEKEETGRSEGRKKNILASDGRTLGAIGGDHRLGETPAADPHGFR